MKEGPMKAMKSMGKDIPGFSHFSEGMSREIGEEGVPDSQEKGSEVPSKGPTQTTEEQVHSEELWFIYGVQIFH